MPKRPPILPNMLEARAVPLEKGWTGSVETNETGPAIVVQRRLRGISERYQIDARIVGTGEARRLDDEAEHLQKIAMAGESIAYW